MLDQLQKLVTIANREAFAMEGHRGTCILTSAALFHALCELGIPARPIRLRAAVHSIRPKEHGVILGSDGGGERLPKSSPGCWWGHLGLAAHERFLLDPTVDQAAEGDEHRQWMRIGPFVGEVTERWLAGQESMSVEHGNAFINYSLFHRQNGFKSAPDWKRKWHWTPLMRQILDCYEREKLFVSEVSMIYTEPRNAVNP